MITTSRFILKEIQDQDIQNIHKGLSNRKITEFYDVHFETLEDTKEQMDWYADLKKNKKGLWWCVFDKETHEFCGAGGYNDWHKTNRKAEIGFWLLQEHWGKGIMKEVMPKLFELGFNQLNLNRIEGYVVSDNMKCKNALEKINFQYEGTMRECEVKNDKTISVDIYSLLRSEWKH